MKLVIEIDDKTYKMIKNSTFFIENDKAFVAIRDGKPLEQEPKTDTWSIKDVADTLAKHGIIAEQEPCEDAVPISVLEEIKAEIKHFMFAVNPSSSESDFACNYILDVIRKYEKGTNND